MKKKLTVLLLALQTFFLTAITLFITAPLSCRITEEGIRFTGGDYIAPVIEAVEVIDECTVQMSFSEKVKVSSVVVSKMLKEISESMEHSSSIELSPAIAAAGGQYGKIEAKAEVSADGQTVTYSLQEACEVGQAYEIFGTVEDNTGNSLTFCLPFTGFNSRVPELLMTEVQIKYSKGKGEFVEFLVKKDGNLGGLELVSGADGDSKKYEFPPVEVKAGEVFLVHLRTAEEGCVNETGDNLNEASAPYSAAGVRDLWSENTTARFNDSSDVILLRNGNLGGSAAGTAILDAFMYAAEDAVEWKKGTADFARAAVEAGIYESDEISEATSSKGATYAKSFHRVNVNESLTNGNSWELGAVSPGAL